jgi:hypothetical protein
MRSDERKERTMRLGIISSSVVVLGLAAAPAGAQDSGEWEHTFAVYMMGAGMEGSVGIGPLTADVNLSFGDIWDRLKLGGMMAYAAERGPLTIAVDVMYTDLEASKQVAGVRFDAEVSQALVSLDVAYRLSERIEVLGGARYNDLDSDVAVAASGGSAELASGSESWVDPYVGARLTVPLGARWTFTLRADVGGFGVGSDEAWQVVSRFGWRATDKVDVVVGYRALSVDYDDGTGPDRFRYDVLTAGPLLGVAWQF